MEAWDKRDGETAVAYEWFTRYREMGGERSLSKVVLKYNRKKSYKSLLARWSARYRWDERTKAWDAYLDGKRQSEQENEILRTAREHITLSDQVMEVLLTQLAVLGQKTLSPTEWRGLAEFAVKTKRDALGIAEKHDLSGTIQVADPIGDRMAKELLERTERLLANRGKGE